MTSAGNERFAAALAEGEGSRADLIEQLHELREFLNGSGPLDGAHFNEWDGVTRIGGYMAAYWWRKHLKRIDAAIAALADQGGAL